jgi:lambda family phage minor tail protein L
MAGKVNPSTARSTIKEISKEISALEASSIISLYEIDLSHIKSNLNLGVSGNLEPHVLRFHNMEAIGQRKIYFRGETYHPTPIITDGFEVSSSGTIPRPTLTFTSFTGIREEAGTSESVKNEYFYSLKRAILELDNMIGAKVTRIRTFYKFLDATNNFEGVGEFTSGLGNNPEFPKEVYYVERKVSEDKDGIQLELASVVDLQNYKIPSRTCLSNRCPWQYRGEGCCYEFKATDNTHAKEQKEAFGATGHLPDFAPPIADDNDDLLSTLITGANKQSLYDPTTVTASSVAEYDSQIKYNVGTVAFVLKDGIRYYYVALKNHPHKGISPPHSLYWVADRCDKSLSSCKLRWGTGGAAKNCKTGTDCSSPSNREATNKFLNFGGFPGTNSKTVTR